MPTSTHIHTFISILYILIDFLLTKFVHLIGSQNALEGVLTTGQQLKASEDMKTAPRLSLSHNGSLISQPKFPLTNSCSIFTNHSTHTQNGY